MKKTRNSSRQKIINRSMISTTRRPLGQMRTLLELTSLQVPAPFQPLPRRRLSSKRAISRPQASWQTQGETDFWVWNFKSLGISASFIYSFVPSFPSLVSMARLSCMLSGRFIQLPLTKTTAVSNYWLRASYYARGCLSRSAGPSTGAKGLISTGPSSKHLSRTQHRTMIWFWGTKSSSVGQAVTSQRPDRSLNRSFQWSNLQKGIA